MDLHFIDLNGNHFVVPDAPEGYLRQDAAEVAPPPGPQHRWLNGGWELPALDLETHRAAAMRSIVSHINTITSSALTAYPAAEVESWPIQKAEAEAVLAAETPTLAMAPFLTGVCQAQFGPADDAARLAQLIEKAQAVKANADVWGNMAAYVNGLRARTQMAIMAAEDVAGADAALAAGIAEGEAFREANGL
jgi:hypothetical protein